MFEELFEGPIARARQIKSPLPEERRRFLSHLQGLGYARSSLRVVACELIVIASRLDLARTEPQNVTVVEAAARRWAAHQMRRHHSANPALSIRNFRYWAEQWLRYLGRWQESAPGAAPPFRALLDAFTAWMADEQGLAPASIRSHGWKAATFLAWYGWLERPFAAVTIQDVDNFLAAKGKTTWSRRSVAIAAQALRALFRYAEGRQQCRAGIAAAIAGPRLFDQETLPSGPPWADVKTLITRQDTDRPADIRRRAALLLFATYGLRVSEVARLTLDDLDWEQALLHVRRSKRHGVQMYPLAKEVGEALLRYITHVRPRGRSRQVFLTALAPHRPISCAGLWSVASQALLASADAYTPACPTDMGFAAVGQLTHRWDASAALRSRSVRYCIIRLLPDAPSRAARTRRPCLVDGGSPPSGPQEDLTDYMSHLVVLCSCRAHQGFACCARRSAALTHFARARRRHLSERADD